MQKSQSGKRRHFKNHPFNIWLLIWPLFTLFVWALLIYTIFFISPKTWENYYYLPFFILTFTAFASLIHLFIKKIIVIILIPFGLISFLILRLFNFDQWYYPFFIIAIVGSLIYFFTAEDRSGKLPDNNLNN